MSWSSRTHRARSNNETRLKSSLLPVVTLRHFSGADGLARVPRASGLELQRRPLGPARAGSFRLSAQIGNQFCPPMASALGGVASLTVVSAADSPRSPPECGVHCPVIRDSVVISSDLDQDATFSGQAWVRQRGTTVRPTIVWFNGSPCRAPHFAPENELDLTSCP